MQPEIPPPQPSTVAQASQSPGPRDDSRLQELAANALALLRDAQRLFQLQADLAKERAIGLLWRVLFAVCLAVIGAVVIISAAIIAVRGMVLMVSGATGSSAAGHLLVGFGLLGTIGLLAWLAARRRDRLRLRQLQLKYESDAASAREENR